MPDLNSLVGDDSIDLVARIRDGDEQAFAELVERYLESLTRYAYSYTRDESAHDVVQEVFTRIWSLGPHWTPKGSVVGYLFTAVRNRAVDLARSEQVNQRVRDSIQLDSYEDRVEPAFPTDAMLAEQVQQEIAALTERQRDALRLRYNYGHTAPQIAEILGINTKAAEKLLSRAMGTLRERLSRFKDDQ
jgi:RNA polymerase sigma-70 factor (ECF subfamily)